MKAVSDVSWRLGWPPWESDRVREDRQQALDELERSTVDLRKTRRSVRRTAEVADSLQHAKERNHFSESMEALFASHRRNGKGAP